MDISLECFQDNVAVNILNTLIHGKGFRCHHGRVFPFQDGQAESVSEGLSKK